MRACVLIVEDEPAQAAMLSYNLEREGFDVVTADDGARGLELVDEACPDLVVLDWMLPEVSGIEVCRRLRAKPGTKSLPILMLTARGEEAERIRSLEMGADDHVVKPYSLAEVIARIHALLRRSRPALAHERVECAGVVMDLAQRKVSRNGRSVHLGPTEFRLLFALMERPGRVFSRSQLLDLVWGRDLHVEERTVDVHVNRLRKALNAAGETDPVRTVRGAGYAFDGDG